MSLYKDFAQSLLIAYDGISGRHVYQCQKYLEQTEWMTKEQLRLLQLKRFKALLRHAYDNVPYYHRTFRSVHFHPSDFHSFDDLRKIPILTKKTIRDKLNEMLAKDFPRNKLICRKTSGTTSIPTEFYRDKMDVSWGVAGELRGYGWAGCKVGDKTAMIGAFPPELMRNVRFKIENFLNRYKILLVNTLSERSMESFARKMRRFRPEFIRGNSSQINIFAIYLQRTLQYEISPRAVFTTGEALLPHYRKRIEDVFGCKTYDYYGSNEVSHVAMQCGENEAHHVIEENIHVECVEGDEMVSDGEKGNVLFTNLHSYAMPFIRFEVGDEGKILGNDCSCGRQSSLFEPIGRNLDYFVNSDGSFTFLRDYGLLFEDVPIEDFQVIQKSQDEIVIRVIPGVGFTDRHVEFLQKNAKLRGRANVTVELAEPMSLSRSDKVRHLVSKVPSCYT